MASTPSLVTGPPPQPDATHPSNSNELAELDGRRLRQHVNKINSLEGILKPLPEIHPKMPLAPERWLGLSAFSSLAHL